MGKTLEYDDNGAYFGYFIISLVSFFLFPLTWYIFKNIIIGKPVNVPKNRCSCRPCKNKDIKIVENSIDKKRSFRYMIFLLVLWIIYAYFITVTKNFRFNTKGEKKFDPFRILGVDQDASVAEVKSAYRKLAIKSHPDRGGDVDDYILLTRAYKSLTDPILRENFEKYGNPDGPSDTSLGIALPAWLIDKKYSKIVLILYFLFIIIGLPAIIIGWWYYNQKFYSDKLLNNTLQLFVYFIHHTPDMKWKRMLTILCACEELDNKHCPNMVIKSNDGKEIRDLVQKMKITPKKEACLNQNYCVKARALLFAHLERVEISSALKFDLDVLLQKLMYLMSEFQLLMMGYMFRKIYNESAVGPSLESFLTSLKLSAAIIQGMAISDSPLLQLPYFDDELVVQIQRKKKSLSNVQHFVALNDKDRSFILRKFDDAHIEDIYSCIKSMPSLSVKSQIRLGDENKNEVEFFGIITVIIRVERASLYSKLQTTQDSTQNPPEAEQAIGEFDEVQDMWESHKALQNPPLYYVHSPSFPCFKKEGWWAFIVNSYNQMVNVPIYFNFTTDVEYIKFQYQAPPIIGTSKYKCHIISDSYLDFTYSHDFSVQIVKPVPVKEEQHPQWEDLSEADEKAIDPEVLTDTECKLEDEN